MIQRIRSYVNDLFKDAPFTKKTMELKEEVCANLIDKFVDLTGQGMPEEEAYNAAIASIGDIDELFDMMKREQQQEEDPHAKKRSALLVSSAIALYIVSTIPLFLADVLKYDAVIGLVFTCCICAVATALLIYNSMTRPKYHKLDDTMVEEFKEWKQQSGQQYSWYGAASGLLWTLIVAFYFIVSFLFNIWAVSWIIFIIGAALQQILRAAMFMKR